MDISKYLNKKIEINKISMNGNGDEIKTFHKIVDGRIKFEVIRYIDKNGNVQNARGTIKTMEPLTIDMEIIDIETNVSYRLETCGPVYDLDGSTINHFKGVLV